MYNSQIVTERIKKAVKENGTSMDALNSECNLSKNTISSASKSSEGMKAKNLYSIAEFLNVSVDYLLGRTNNPQSHIGGITVTGNSQQSVTGGNTISVNSGDEEDELMTLFKGLSLIDRAKVIVYIDGLRGRLAEGQGGIKL